jgi:hypothetical protein
MPELQGKIALIAETLGMNGVGRATTLKPARQGADLALRDVQRGPKDLLPARGSGRVARDRQRGRGSPSARVCYALSIGCDKLGA